MTRREELHAKIDALSDASLERVAEYVERQAKVERHMAALEAFSSGWTPEEAAAFEEGTRRGPWRTSPNDQS